MDRRLRNCVHCFDAMDTSKVGRADMSQYGLRRVSAPVYRRSVRECASRARQAGPGEKSLMSTIVQVDFRASTLNLREEILQSLGRPVFSLLGSEAARRFDLTTHDVGVISIGHDTRWQERRELVAYFKTVLPRVPVLASLRRTDDPITEADENCPADNPPLWIRTVQQLLQSD